MESSEHNWANISETICPTMLVFGKKASWLCFFQNILTNPIISQIQFFMMSYFIVLYCRLIKKQKLGFRECKLVSGVNFIAIVLSYSSPGAARAGADELEGILATTLLIPYLSLEKYR